eukprot:Skav228626  [mRNA]  locus=scaffold2037:526119:531100:+ [translate_table: standard]
MQETSPVGLWSLRYPSAAVAVPVRLLRLAFWTCVDRLLFPVLETLTSCLWHLVNFAVYHPLLSIPAVLFVNIHLVRFLSASSSYPVVQLLGFGSSHVAQLLQDFAEIRHGATDSTLALVLISLVQAAAYAMVDGVLWVLCEMPLLDSSGTALSYEELNEVASAMVDPRQCARCGAPTAGWSKKVWF